MIYLKREKHERASISITRNVVFSFGPLGLNTEVRLRQRNSVNPKLTGKRATN